MSARSAVAVEQLLKEGKTAKSLAELELWLAQQAFSAFDSEVADFARSVVTSGGKRLRPLLLFLVAGERADHPTTVTAAGAIELLHNATLVHDDVLDDAPLRRGRATIYKQAGAKAAVATGDFMFANAFRALALVGASRQLKVLAAASTALAEGELMQRSDSYDLKVTEQRYLQRCQLKTAALFEAACEIGVICSDQDLPKLSLFGRYIGLAFQLFDDILDVVGSPEQTGKRVGTDLLDGTVNLPLIYAAGSDTELANLDLRCLEGAKHAEQICAQILASGAIDRVRARALEFVELAKAQLQPIADTKLSVQLGLVADGVVDRYA